MDNQLKKYRQIIVQLLQKYADMPSISDPNSELEEQLILDTERDHYQILTIGWEKSHRVYYPILHIDIKKYKIWVQEDATDFNFVEQLESLGVPKSDIVLAFHPPYKRPDTNYATA
jgi:XisI protein